MRFAVVMRLTCYLGVDVRYSGCSGHLKVAEKRVNCIVIDGHESDGLRSGKAPSGLDTSGRFTAPARAWMLLSPGCGTFPQPNQATFDVYNLLLKFCTHKYCSTSKYA